MNESTGKLILRLALGLMLIMHGIHKLIGGIDYLDGMLAGAGLPTFLKYGVYIGEVLAPLAVIAGYYARIGAWVIAVNMVFAIALVGAQDMFTLSPKTGGLAPELEYFYLFSAIALALIGPGRYAVNQK
jgi:putative oxidoreductase